MFLFCRWPGAVVSWNDTEPILWPQASSVFWIWQLTANTLVTCWSFLCVCCRFKPAIFLYKKKTVCVFESKWFCIITVVVWCHLLHVLYLNSVVFLLPSTEFCIIKKSDKWSKRDLAWKMESVNNDIRNLKDSFSEQMMRVGLITSQRCSLS